MFKRRRCGEFVASFRMKCNSVPMTVLFGLEIRGDWLLNAGARILMLRITRAGRAIRIERQVTASLPTTRPRLQVKDQLDKAVVELRRCRSHFSLTWPDGTLHLGVLFWQRGEFEKASETTQLAITSQTRTTRGHTLLGRF